MTRNDGPNGTKDFFLSIQRRVFPSPVRTVVQSEGWVGALLLHLLVQTPAVARVASPPLMAPWYAVLILAEWWASRNRKLGL